jgi:hypothetical protein
MKRRTVLGLLVIASVLFGTNRANAEKRLRVSENHRYLEYTDGTPFFYLGDTAGELFHRLNREQADRYPANRAAKGFTVIQAVVLAELKGPTDPNPYGAVPLADRDPTQPNEILWANVPWYESLDHPGAFQMGIVRRLFESRPFEKLEPAPSIIVEGPETGGAKIRAALASDGSFAFVYSPRGESFMVRLNAIRAPRVAATWFDPRYGIAEPLHTSDNVGFQTFVPPTSGRGCDWVLVLDEAARSFPALGASQK